MTKQIDIQSNKASITTMSASISVIQINKKQMTLAVFRQIPIVEIKVQDILNDCIGVEFWGLVSYSIKYEGDLWLVGVADNILVKCCFDFDIQSLNNLKYEIKRLEDYINHGQYHPYIKNNNEAIEKLKEEKEWMPECIILNKKIDELRSLPQLFIAV